MFRIVLALLMLAVAYSSGLAAPLHDVGKIGIPDSILRKPGKLTNEEFDVMQTHTVIGASILAVALVFFWFYYPPAIEYEDRKLRRIFDTEWDEWASHVPALVPALGKVSSLRGGSWSLTRSMRRNGEGFIALYVIACAGAVVLKLL